MATYNTVIKKRNAANNGWDSILPITTADNVLVDENGRSVKDHLADNTIHRRIILSDQDADSDLMQNGDIWIKYTDEE